jgi:TolA-binding protein
MTREQSPEDLLIRARRDELDPRDERRFMVAVQSSRELELLYTAGLEFDVQAGLLPGDEARMSRLVQRTLRAATQADGASTRRASLARPVAVGVACGVLSFVALASAWQYVEHLRRTPASGAQPASQVVARAERPAPPARASGHSANPAPSAVPEERALLPEPTPSRARSAARTAATRKTPEPRPSAAELFALASAARRAGDIEAAIASYERLCQEYPSSLEAEDAKVLLGNLRLSQRAPRAALQQFEGYGSGPLSLEAAWGRAQALRTLESPEERGVLEGIIREFPSSPYASAARKRLEELAR